MSKHAKHARTRSRARRRLSALLPAGLGGASLLAGSAAAMTLAPAAVPPVSGPALGTHVMLAATVVPSRRAAPARRAAAVARYALKPGEYLSEVARRFCGTPRDWVGIWHATPGITDPNVVDVGQVIRIACNDRGPGYRPRSRAVTQAAVISAPPPSRPADRFDGKRGECGDGDGDGMDAPCSVIFPSHYQAPARHGTAQQAPVAHAVSYQAPVTVSTGGMGSYQACVIRRESGGNSQVMNSSGHYGLYQFDYGTWVSGGGIGADFGHASVAEQSRVFSAVYAARGTQPWSPSDGC